LRIVAEELDLQLRPMNFGPNVFSVTLQRFAACSAPYILELGGVAGFCGTPDPVPCNSIFELLADGKNFCWKFRFR